VICEQGYVSAPVCSPSRAGFLTGRNQVGFGYDNNLAENQPGFDPEFGGLPVGEVTLADRLQAGGYVTGLVGKWHLGVRPQFHPVNRGFKEFWGFLGGSHNYFPKHAGLPEPNIECNYREPQPITYLTDTLGDEMVAFIDRHRSEPFFLYGAFNAPHTPMQATEADLARFAQVPGLKRRTYCAMVHRLDVNVGRILDAVDAAGLTDRTLVAFISDNGGPVDQNDSINAPLNGQKGILLEGGIRVPFIVSWPGTLPAGTRYPHPVTSLDFAPTLLAAAGVAAGPDDRLDGVNLLPYLTGQRSAAPHERLLWRFTISAAIREEDWKLVRLPDRLPLLYRLSGDVSEQDDLALQNLDRVRGMLRRLGDWDVRLPHPLFLEGAVWKDRQRKLYDRSYPLTQPPAAD
jgi:arylsulfatase A-like enzyme